MKGIPGTNASGSGGKHRIELKDVGFRLKTEIKLDPSSVALYLFGFDQVILTFLTFSLAKN